MPLRKALKDDAALAVVGTSVSTHVKLPDNLVSGTYSFVVEPVLNNPDEDDLEGLAVTSNTIPYTNPGYGGIVASPTGVSVSNTGNGITKVEWDYDPTVYSWDIIIRNVAGDKVGAAAVLSSELALLKNLYVDPLSGDQSVEVTTDIKSDRIEYEVTDEFGNEYSGSIEFDEYMDLSGGSSCFILSL